MPTIEFTAYSEDTVKNFKPVLAQRVKPDWWKRMRVQELVQGQHVHTIRACPAMDDWTKMGWYLLANRDIGVINGNNPTDDDDVKFTTMDFEGLSYNSSTHPHSQMGNVFNYMEPHEAPIKDAFKMKNPWNIVTPKGYSCFYLDPFLHQNKFFKTWQGIIDTDSFNKNIDNAQIIFYPVVSHSFIIKKGTPLCQIIPFKRDEWKGSYQLRDHEEYMKVESNITSPYDSDDPTKRPMPEWNRENPRDGMKFSLGSYRKHGYWAEKSKFFKEDAPPPECPIHKDETQTEMDFDIEEPK
jgi:hypothetical protein|tara:strand:- start:523 stop:1410 length:888 start_codon:yes stop_codon:yes gene_type:complete